MMKTLAFVGNSRKGGVGVYQLNRADGSLTPLKAALPDLGASPLTPGRDGMFLYAAIRGEPWRVAAFRVDPFAGEPHLLNMVDVPVTPIHMAVDPSGRFLVVSSYLQYDVLVLALGREGMVQREPACVLRPGRNPHCACFSPSGKFVYIPVLGNGVVARCRFDSANGGLTLAPSPSSPFVPAGRETGPRHIVLRPDGRFAYAIMEMSGEIASYAIHGEEEALTLLHSVPFLPPERRLPLSSYTPPSNAPAGGNSPTPVMWGAEIRVTPDGRFLYASERTGSTISGFRIDPVSGRLDFIGVWDTEKQPRSFAVEPFGKYIITAGEKSNCVRAHAIDPETGALTSLGGLGAGDVPNWVEIVTYPTAG